MKSGLNRTGLRPWALGIVAMVLSALMLGSAALAQRDRRAAPPRWHGDISRFHEQDWHLWRSGHWEHVRHAGRTGWWWVVGGSWYFYPAPVYPYPNPWEPPSVLVLPPVEAAPPPTAYWYYCEASRGYYPYVSSCPGGWKPIPATPSGASPAPAR